MIRRTARFSAPFTLPLVAMFAWLFGGCGDSDVVIAETNEAGPPPSFTAPDAGPAPVEAGLTSYCPSDRCPEGHTTCPGSFFPCDVDLKTDRNNCGACGVACPAANSTETYDCVDGSCVMTCNIGPIRYYDCDGVPDNGCETRPETNDNCGACGFKCLDPDKPCVERNWDDFGCGCPDPLIYCPADETQKARCVNKNDDANCGACGNACDPEGDGGPRPDNTYYGCENATCGNLKCSQGYANCDGDKNNGCEASLMSDEHCGGCNKACAAGTKCALGTDGRAFCACPDNKTFCGTCPKFCTEDGSFCLELPCFGSCHDLTSDVNACGSCSVSCDEGNPHAEPFCAYGTCKQRCPIGRADCNGNASDGCEVDTMSDPKNCGGCGVACDAIAGQACVDGRCMVEPCDQLQDAGEMAR